METATEDRMVCRGVVRGVRGEQVLVLVEHNDYGETVLCHLEKELWQCRHIVIGQQVSITWSPDAPDSTVSLDIMEEPAASEAPPFDLSRGRSLLSLRPRDKVLIVVAGNRVGPMRVLTDKLMPHLKGPDDSALLNEAVRLLALKSAGWGELMLLPRLLSCMHSMGVRAPDIAYKLCESTAASFRPSEYADRHVIFLGSPKSNEILRGHYWDRLPLQNEYTFEHYALAVRHKGSGKGNGIKFEIKEEIPHDALENPAGINTTDYFLLAKVANPYSDPPARYICLLLCGVGTVGTGYAGITAVGQQSTGVLHGLFGDEPFEIVGRVEMRGMFDPRNDPVFCVYDGQTACEFALLRHAMASASLSDPQEAYTDDDLLADLKCDPEFAKRL